MRPSRISWRAEISMMVALSNVRGRRSRMEIIAKILEACLAPARRTHIMYKSYIDFRCLNRYVSLLEGKGLIKVLGNDPTLYVITEKGREFLRKYQEVKKILG